VLDGERIGALADAGQRHFALVAVERGGADFDEFVRCQGAVDFGDDGVGEALFTQLKDRVQGVGAGLERLAFGRSHESFFCRRRILSASRRKVRICLSRRTGAARHSHRAAAIEDAIRSL